MTEKKRKLFITLGIILALTPFLGIPSSWKTFVYVVIGLLVALISFFINKSFNIETQEKEVFTESFTENEKEDESH